MTGIIIFGVILVFVIAGSVYLRYFTRGRAMRSVKEKNPRLLNLRSLYKALMPGEALCPLA
jgi:hypothetical protein